MHPARDSIVHIIDVCSGGKLSDPRSKQFQLVFYAVAAVLNVLALLAACMLLLHWVVKEGAVIEIRTPA